MMLRTILSSKQEALKTFFLFRRIQSTHSASVPDDVNQFDKAAWETAKPFDSIPGPKPIPLLGNTWRFMPWIGDYYGVEVSEIIAKFRQSYGDIVKISDVLTQPIMVYLYNPDDIEKIYKLEGASPNKQVFPSLEWYRDNKRQDVYKNAKGLVSTNGEEWYDFRSKVNPVMMQPRNMKQYVTPVDVISKELIDKIKRLRKDDNKIDMDFMKEINKWSLENSAAIALDTRLNCLADDLPQDSIPSKMIQGSEDVFTLSNELDFRPSLWRYIATPKFKKLMKVFDDQTNMNKKFIDEAIERISKNQSTEGDTSILEKLIKIDKNVAIVMASDTLFAGVDTTSFTLVNALYYLSLNEDKQDILRNEIKSILPNKDSELVHDHLGRMPYLRACIKEAARLYPVTLGTVRSLHKDTVLSGYRIPKGTMVLFLHAYLSLQESQFPRPMEFIPERWLRDSSNPELSYKKAHPFSSLPFGFGARSCVGRRIAELELEIGVVHFIKNFKLSWDGPPPTRATTSINTLKPPFNFVFKNAD